MNEDFLHYIWKYGLYDLSDLRTTEGRRVRVYSPGFHNRDAGPDFLEAKLLIGKVMWIGHVEIHINSSDWEKHKHQYDKAYDPVILHVVKRADKKISNSVGVLIPTIELKINSEFYSRYQMLVSEIQPIPCGRRWQDLSPVKVENAIVAMGVERMESRKKELAAILMNNKGGMRELFLQILCRGFGFGKNHHSMEALAKSINPIWIEKHYANLFQLESIFFGQSGLMPERNQDPYLSALRTEYNYLSRKYNMARTLGYSWKYLRMRPGNFPTVRLAQLCSFLEGNNDLVAYCLDVAGNNKLNNISVKPSSYWQTHYDFGKKIKETIPSMGKSSKLLLMINVFLPLNGFFRDSGGDKEAMEIWLEQLEQLPPEDNRVIRLWQENGFRIPNAFYSQSFFFIYKNFCTQKKCLECRIGQLILGTEK